MPTKIRVCRLIADLPLPGPRNMAVDEVLLRDAAESGIATLRFYQWSEPTLSLGYFQRLADRHRHAASHACAIVRRQTGGGAILHDRELTYSLALPAGHPLARCPEALYAEVHEAFIAVLQPPGEANNSRWKLRRHCQASEQPPDREPFLCFQRRARGDVVAVDSEKTASGPVATDRALQVDPRPRAPRHAGAHADEDDVKILGSAQRRHRGAILQHGSLLLERSTVAPELAGWRDLTGAAVTIPLLVENLSVRLAAALGTDISPTTIPTVLESEAHRLANTKYEAPAWTNRR